MSEEIVEQTEQQVFDPKSDEPVKLAEFTDGSEKESSGNDASWYLAPDIPGVGEIPEWYDQDKFPTVLDLAKGASGLRQKLGAFTGAPEEYKLSVSEDLPKDVSLNPEDPLLKSFQEFAKESNMSQDSFDKVIDMYLGQYKESLSGESTANEEYYKEELAKLGDNAQEKLDVVQQWGKNNLPEDLFGVFKESVISADMIRLFDHLRQGGRGSDIPTNAEQAVGLTREMLTERMKDPRQMQGGEFASKTNEMYQQYYNAHPSEL